MKERKKLKNMKTDSKNIDSLPENMVLIRQKCGIKVF